MGMVWPKVESPWRSSPGGWLSRGRGGWGWRRWNLTWRRISYCHWHYRILKEEKPKRMKGVETGEDPRWKVLFKHESKRLDDWTALKTKSYAHDCRPTSHFRPRFMSFIRTPPLLFHTESDSFRRLFWRVRKRKGRSRGCIIDGLEKGRDSGPQIRRLETLTF